MFHGWRKGRSGTEVVFLIAFVLHFRQTYCAFRSYHGPVTLSRFHETIRSSPRYEMYHPEAYIQFDINNFIHPDKSNVPPLIYPRNNYETNGIIYYPTCHNFPLDEFKVTCQEIGVSRYVFTAKEFTVGETVKGRRSGLIFVRSGGSRMAAMLNFVSSLAGGIRRPARKRWGTRRARTMMYSFSRTRIVDYYISYPMARRYLEDIGFQFGRAKSLVRFRGISME